MDYVSWHDFLATNFTYFKVDGRVYKAPDQKIIVPLFFCQNYIPQIRPSQFDGIDEY